MRIISIILIFTFLAKISSGQNDTSYVKTDSVEIEGENYAEKGNLIFEYNSRKYLIFEKRFYSEGEFYYKGFFHSPVNLKFRMFQIYHGISGTTEIIFHIIETNEFYKSEAVDGGSQFINFPSLNLEEFRVQVLNFSSPNCGEMPFSSITKIWEPTDVYMKKTLMK